MERVGAEEKEVSGGGKKWKSEGRRGDLWDLIPEDKGLPGAGALLVVLCLQIVCVLMGKEK